MAGMEKISEAILDKVKADAQQIIKEAEEKALNDIQEAEKQKEARFAEKKRRVIEEAKGEATRILAQASIQARQELSRAKAAVIDEVVNKVRATLSETSSDKSSLLNLITEAIAGLAADKVRLFVSSKDMSTAQELIKGNRKLAAEVTEIKEFNSTGGVIVESLDGKLRIDNTYESRLEMLLPKMLPEIGRALFQDLP